MTMAEIKTAIELNRQDRADLLHKTLLNEMRALLEHWDFALKQLRVKYDSEGNIEDVLINYEDRHNYEGEERYDNSQIIQQR